MNVAPHPYQTIPLSLAGLVFGGALTLFYGLVLWKSERAKEIARGLARNEQAGVYLMGFGMVWFWLLVAPEGKGIFSSLSMDLGEFNKVKPFLVVGVPLFCVGMIMLVREFLFVRALGLFLLMVSAPLLYASDFEPARFQFVMPLVCYLMIIKGLYFVGMPYLFRDGVNWALDKPGRWRGLVLTGFGVGILFLVLSVTAWRGF